MNNKCCQPQNGPCDTDITGEVPVISTTLSPGDHIGAFKARLGIGRMDYTVKPGLYAVGKPGNASPVLVSANYKLTFDTVRKNLAGVDCWLLILDTNGVNVWCAAGEGTFGTDELVRRIETSELSKYVTHKKLILPQLGATGVAAHEVKRRSGYDVEYGPVRAGDIKAYIDAGYAATGEMRTVNFTMWDRIVLTPMELVPALKISLPLMGVMLLANKVIRKPFDKTDFAAFAGGILSGSVITPTLLPFIPGKAFALKGWLAGLCATALAIRSTNKHKRSPLLTAGHLLLFPALSSFIAMNFTGASTYTSPSGVNSEMKKALPFIVGATAIGGLLTLGVHLFGSDKKP